MAQSSILLLDSDPAAEAVVRGVLGGVGYAISAVADPDEAFRRASEHELVIIDVVSGERSAQDICREIRSTPALAAIPILCISQDDDVEQRIRFLEVGADDVMAKPFDARELEARVEALLLRFRRSKSLTPTTALVPASVDGASPHRTIACFSPKGGAGTTTVAVNVATALAMMRRDRVAIVDLDLQFGQVATHLNLDPVQTLAELSRDEQALREPELIRTYMTRHDTTLQVLAAPRSPELAELIIPEHVGHLLATVRSAFEVTVFDAGSTLDERILTLFENVDTVLIPIYPEIAALRALHSLIEYLTESGTVVAKTMFVANNVFSREMLKMRDVEAALGAKVSAELPYDPILYLKAVNEGVPIVRGAPSSVPAQKLRALASSLVVMPGEPAEAPHEERRSGRFAGLLRRA